MWKIKKESHLLAADTIQGPDRFWTLSVFSIISKFITFVKEIKFMENYVSINGKKILFTAEQVAQIAEAFCEKDRECEESKIVISEDGCFKIGEHEFIVLESDGERVCSLLKGTLGDNAFGDNNNYNGSEVDKLCTEFADKVSAIVGADNLIPFNVDLTANDGLKDYGTIERRAALLTADQARRYVDVLDKHKLEDWWWLATPYSTPKHDNETWILCVSPSGFINNCTYLYCNYYGGIGVRPFCILKSSIFES